MHPSTILQNQTCQKPQTGFKNIPISIEILLSYLNRFLFLEEYKKVWFWINDKREDGGDY